MTISFTFTKFDEHNCYTTEGKVINGSEKQFSHWWLQSSSHQRDELIVFRLWYRFVEKKAFWIKLMLMSKHGIESLVYEPGEQLGDVNLRCLEWNTKCTKEMLLKRDSMPNNTLSILAEVSLEDPLTMSEEKSRLILNKKMNNLLRMFIEEQLCDFKIIVDKREINTHKIILASESKVFMAMFDSDMKEKRENCLEITDFKYESIYAIVKFMYCHQIDDIEKIAYDLLALAEKYDIPELKLYCERYFYSILSKDNCLDVLQLAETYNTMFLKNSILKMVDDKWPELKGTERWKLLNQDYQELCGKLSANVKI
ncbi:speckle-type POZ protein A-like protein [Dinothrombium tinctorium]|uniref:Speckle-type POZ protein A-like protein n=1 Tax=Dinothrombium tinctorium TaxID=1965070 RepID=A0A3S3Q788_9ACAR|nr:speckle-type POZ protein A-like protein [Dinothrombium tinctorium]